jgi:hypothetical protein
MKELSLHILDITKNSVSAGATHIRLALTETEDHVFTIVIADHGGANSPDGKGHHGGWTDGEKYVTFAAAGKGVNAVEIEEMNIRDLASIVLYALGIDVPEIDEQGWTSQIPAGMFTDSTIPAYRDLSHLTGAEPRISKAPHTSELL